MVHGPGPGLNFEGFLINDIKSAPPLAIKNLKLDRNKHLMHLPATRRVNKVDAFLKLTGKSHDHKPFTKSIWICAVSKPY